MARLPSILHATSSGDRSASDALDAMLPGLMALGMPVCFILSDHRYGFANAAYADLLGRSRESLVGKRVDEILNTTEYAVVHPQLETAIAAGQSVSFNRKARDTAGQEKWMQVNYFPQRLGDGKVFGVLAVVTSAERIKTLERETLEREQLLRSLTDRAGLPIAHVSASLRFLFVNQPFLDWVGRSKSDVVDQAVRDVFPLEVVDFYYPLAMRALAGETFKAEFASTARRGDVHHMEVNFFPDAVADGTVTGFFFMVRDIEQEFQLRQSLIKKEMELRAIADNIAIPISKSDRDFRYQYVNRVACEWFGRAESEIVGRRWPEIVGQAQFEQIQQRAARALAGEIVTYERYAEFPGRPGAHIRVNIFPSRSPQGDIDGVYVVINDVDADHRLREELLARERRIRLITDNVGLPISYIDADMRVQFCNQPGLNWINLTEDELVGRRMDEVFGAEAVAQIAPHLTQALAGTRQTYERMAKNRGGENRWIRGHMVPDFDEQGRVVGVFTVLTDIDSDVRLRRDLEEQGRQIRLFTDNIPESIAYLSNDRRYKFVNNTFLRQRGLPREQIIGRTSAEVLGQVAADLAVPHVERAFRGETVVYERLVSVPAGTPGVNVERWHRIRTVPDFGADGCVQGIYVVGIDIHDIKTAQDVLRTNEAELRQAMDSLPYPMAYVDKSLTYQFVNRSMEAMVGKSREEMVGAAIPTLFSPLRMREFEPILARVMAGETFTLERLITSDDDSQRWMNVRYTPRRDADGNVIGFYSASTDIDALKRKELELRRANWMLSSHFENTPLAVIEWDAEFRVRRWSPQAERIFGWTEDEVLGRKLADLHFVVDDDRDDVMDVIGRLQQQDQSHFTSLNRNYRKDGRTIWCEWYNSNLLDDEGKLVSVLSLAQDVTARVHAEERLVHQATHDSLTGLPNRALLQDRLRQAITRARRNQTRVATLFIDLDRFKDVNDTLGHRVGDELLRAMATRLNETVRETDILVRLSGDEFMVVLEQVADLPAAETVASKLLDEIRSPSVIEGHEIFVSGSIGISVFPDDAEDGDALLRHADLAMYRAKQTGKNTWRMFSAELEEHGSNMRMMENALRASIARNEFELYYQPKVDMVTNRIVGAEALIRWHHPQRGLVMPGEFIHLAEETGLVHRIGDWVLDAAVSQIRAWRDAGLADIQLAINLSAGQFHASNLGDRIIEAVRRENIPPSSIEVEITETGMLKDPEGVGHTITALRESGISVAIDDFGTGYSSLSHLKRFPIDTLKIDRSFVADVLTDRDDAAIVAAVIALAKALDIRVVAEGVETETQRAHLAALGCHAFQGYLVSPALARKDFEALLKRHNRNR
jgi:diguanylate cyclase (GGDEF)-like protein/PAS domain S-box-containing protein